MTVEQIWGICKQTARAPFEPIHLLAICQQESNFDHTEVRLENGFYRKYARPSTLPTTDEVLLSASYGLMQTMGWTLFELGYFGAWEYLNIPKKIDAYMEDGASQVEWGYRTLQAKFARTKDVRLAIRAYNGSGPQAEEYVAQVFNRISQLSKQYT